MYEDLKDEGFEIVAAAQDSGGPEAANPWYERAEATYTALVDEHHVVSRLYNMVNVPTGVWIDEEGRIVRPNEPAYTRDNEMKFGDKVLRTEGEKYVAALRDWVKNGAGSPHVMPPDEVARRIEPPTSDEAQAEAFFQLGLYFHQQENDERANNYWQKAQELRPDSWNYHRQDWSFTPDEANTKWLNKFLELDEPYYPPLDISSKD